MICIKIMQPISCVIIWRNNMYLLIDGIILAISSLLAFGGITFLRLIRILSGCRSSISEFLIAFFSFSCLPTSFWSQYEPTLCIEILFNMIIYSTLRMDEKYLTMKWPKESQNIKIEESGLNVIYDVCLIETNNR